MNGLEEPLKRTVVIFIRCTMVTPTLVIGINIGYCVYFGTTISVGSFGYCGYYCCYVCFVLEVSLASLPPH
jgi:hypothetical protein